MHGAHPTIQGNSASHSLGLLRLEVIHDAHKEWCNTEGTHVVDGVHVRVLPRWLPQDRRHSLRSDELEQVAGVVDLLSTQQLRLHVTICLVRYLPICMQ